MDSSSAAEFSNVLKIIALKIFIFRKMQKKYDALKLPRNNYYKDFFLSSQSKKDIESQFYMHNLDSMIRAKIFSQRFLKIFTFRIFGF